MSAVHRYEGTINQFLGDGFMALFGAPLALEDHARRAVLAALELHANLQERPIKLEEMRLHVQMRIGLNTGLVVVGSIGDNLRMDYTAVGDTTNLAARLQQIAEPGTILMSDAATQLVQDDMQIEPLEPVFVKGKNEPLSVYQVLGRAPSRAPIERRSARILSRFVGRERELQSLREWLDQVKGGQGQIVGIVAEPGMGQSRLLREFHRSLTAQDVDVLQGGCVSYGSAMPYLPVLDLLRDACDIGEADPPEAIRENVRRHLQAVGIAPQEGEPYLLQWLGWQEGVDKLTALSSETIKTRAFEILRQMFLKRSQQRPLIIVVEDLHWIDKSSEDFLVYLSDSLASASILLLATYRPGYRPPWGDKSYPTQIALPRLTPSDSLTVVQSILRKKTFPHSLAQIILEKTDGNPLFLEELTQAIIKHGDMRTGAAVPDTLQGVLMARIDRLPDGTKRLLQTAAILGRSVPMHLLRAIWRFGD